VQWAVFTLSSCPEIFVSVPQILYLFIHLFHYLLYGNELNVWKFPLFVSQPPQVFHNVPALSIVDVLAHFLKMGASCYHVQGVILLIIHGEKDGAAVQQKVQAFNPVRA